MDYPNDKYCRHPIYFGVVASSGLYGIIVKRDQVNADVHDTLTPVVFIGVGIILLCSVAELIHTFYKKSGKVLHRRQLH